MLRLLLLRHAKAAWPPNVPDLERPLAERGRNAAPLMGQYMKDQGLVPDLVLVSPARRTRETWDLVRPILGDIRTVFDGRIYEAPPAQLLSVIGDAPPEARALLMIGHNPGFEDVANLLAGEGEPEALQRMSNSFPTAALAVIDFDRTSWNALEAGSGRLERFTTPKTLGAMEDH